jgi:hypothetical protein
VFTEPIRSRMSTIHETIEKRSGKYVERFWEFAGFFQLDTVEVWGSSPHGPSIQNKNFARIPKKHSGVQKDTLLRPICVLLPEASLLSTELGRILRGIGNGCAARPRREH